MKLWSNVSSSKFYLLFPLFDFLNEIHASWLVTFLWKTLLYFVYYMYKKVAKDTCIYVAPLSFTLFDFYRYIKVKTMLFFIWTFLLKNTTFSFLSFNTQLKINKLLRFCIANDINCSRIIMLIQCVLSDFRIIIHVSVKFSHTHVH